MSASRSTRTANLFKHQRSAIRTLTEYKDIPYVFLIGGFGCGKSTTDVYIILMLINYYRYNPDPVKFGIIGVTIKLLTQTVLSDVETYLDAVGIPYRDNKQAGTLVIGSLTFVYLAMSDPGDIFAHNFCGCIIDEMDELPSEKVLEVVKALQERNRVNCPSPLDREPFMFFSTTAQGLGGTYQLIKYFDEVGLDYAIIRGKTEYNTSLSPSQIKLLRKLYTPDEARAYLDGEFVNLSTGRCYPAFDARKHKYMDFQPSPSDHIYVGQDFNAGYNASVIGICRETLDTSTIYIINAAHFDTIGYAPRALRELYPSNPITMIPDASGKEIMEGYREEMEKYDIELYWNSRNPPITERVTATNRLLWNSQLYVCDNKANSRLLMGLETRDYDDQGKPRKGKGPNALDHFTDACEYLIWHIIYGIQGFDNVLDAIRAVHHHSEVLAKG